MLNFKDFKKLEQSHIQEMQNTASFILKDLPDFVTVKCWTTSLIVLEENKHSTLRLLIDHKVGKEPQLKIQKDVQYLNDKWEDVRKQVVKLKKKYEATIIPLYLQMREEMSNIS